MNFAYIFTFQEGHQIRINVEVRRPQRDDNEHHAEWTHLEYQRCKNCPLSTEEHKYCPVALDIENTAKAFSGAYSYDPVTVHVHSPNREYRKDTDVQTGLNSLIGLIMSTGNCPILSRLRPMALNHLPFSSLEETILRTSGIYLLREYMKSVKGEIPDYSMANLEKLYKELRTVNRALKQRLDGAAKTDATINAINAFFSLSALVEMSVKEHMLDLEMFFEG
jgi:hypothetical protein